MDAVDLDTGFQGPLHTVARSSVFRSAAYDHVNRVARGD
jgi:hypothetical protein